MHLSSSIPESHAKTALLTSPSDQSLLEACRQGDTVAWSRLVEKYQRLVYSIPLNYGLSTEDAADIAQVVFTSLIQGLDSLHENSNLGGWLATVTRRHTWRVVKRKKRDQTDEELDSEAAHELIPERTNAIERWELAEWLNTGLNLVGERCRRLLMLLYFETEEPSYVEIAQQLNMSVGSVGPTRARCLQRMKEMLQSGEQNR